MLHQSIKYIQVNGRHKLNVSYDWDLF